jgi:hypothetical protein
MVHPFDVELGDDGRLYVSSQDTNTVLAILPKTRKPAPVASHLLKSFPNGNFLPGTLVASSLGRLHECGERAPLDVPSPQGLKVVLDVHGRPRHSVRGIVVHRKHLYVAGEAGNVVKVYELKTGRLVARIHGKKLAKPVHLLLHGDTLYIGSAGTAASLPTTFPKRLRAASSSRAPSSTASSKLRQALPSARTAILTWPNVSISGSDAFPSRERTRGRSSKDCRTFRSS